MRRTEIVLEALYTYAAHQEEKLFGILFGVLVLVLEVLEDLQQ